MALSTHCKSMADSGLTKLIAAAAVEWVDLPADLLEFIHGKLENCREVIKLRSVCRWWRFSTPPPPNKISGLFPLRFSFLGKPKPQYDLVMRATAVYLLRQGNSAAWMVSVQEKAAGDLVLRHPLNYREIPNKKIDSDWITASRTPISRSYAHNSLCTRTRTPTPCNRVISTHKVTFILETSCGSGSSELVGLCTDLNCSLTAFRIELGETTTAVAASTSRYHSYEDSDFLDSVTFKSRIFAFDTLGRIYILDHKTLDMIQIGAIPSADDYFFIRFVVSEGDLYLVVVSDWDDCIECLVYRVQVVVMADESCEIRVEQVEELGEDTVFFIGMTDSFSVSARLLPPPWKGNCVVFGGNVSSMCGCYFSSRYIHDDPVVFFLGGGGGAHSYARFSSLPQGYSDLFSPPPTHLLSHYH